jgi:hypothetical protein
MAENANKVKTAIARPPRILELYAGINGGNVKQITVAAVLRRRTNAATGHPPIAPMAHMFEQMDIAPVRVHGRFWSGSK